jgi:xanthine dehydrogenase iron-sulfur cluster and FAD-binding subunit A
VVPQGGHPRGNAISKIVFAGVRAERPRLAFGSVAPTTVRLPRTEAALATGASLADATAVLRSEITPIDDLRSTARYRLQVAENLLAQFWLETEPDRQPLSTRRARDRPKPPPASRRSKEKKR